jgi:hypothetical protein
MTMTAGLAEWVFAGRPAVVLLPLMLLLLGATLVFALLRDRRGRKALEDADADTTFKCAADKLRDRGGRRASTNGLDAAPSGIQEPPRHPQEKPLRDRPAPRDKRR